MNLETFVGNWTMRLSNAAFLSDPHATVEGSVIFEWFEGEAILIMRQGIKGSGTPWAVWLIGKDEDASGYTALYTDDRGVSRVYHMSFEKDGWKIWRNTPKFSQRFEGKINEDGKTIQPQWQKSFDGKKWEHGFDISYTKKV